MNYPVLLLFAAMLVLPASASVYGPDEIPGVDEWSPQQVVDYIYVNDTVNRTIEYWIITNDTIAECNWTVNGVDVAGSKGGADGKYTLSLTWDNESIGLNTVGFTGKSDSQEVKFIWYVNIIHTGYEHPPDTGIFDIMDNALENYVNEVKIRMFKFQMAKHGNQPEYIAEKKVRLHNEIANRQMTREAVRLAYKAGEITREEYIAALQEASMKEEYNQQQLEVIEGSEKTSKENNGKHKGAKNKSDD